MLVTKNDVNYKGITFDKLMSIPMYNQFEYGIYLCQIFSKEKNIGVHANLYTINVKPNEILFIPLSLTNNKGGITAPFSTTLDNFFK